MYYSGLYDIDSTNGIGVGVSLFVSGCRHHCKGCFNPETWNFNNGIEYTDDTLKEIISLIDRPYIDYFSILGGDPFEPENMPTVLDLVETIRIKFNNLQINIWSGYLYEDLLKDSMANKILQLCDILIDGEYEEDKRDLKLELRGSYNQRVIDLRKSLDTNSVILSPLNNKIME